MDWYKKLKITNNWLLLLVCFGINSIAVLGMNIPFEASVGLATATILRLEY